MLEMVPVVGVVKPRRRGGYPSPPVSTRLPTDPAAAERARQAQANIAARKPRPFTVTKDADGNVVLTLDDGTVAKLPTAN